MPRDESEIVTLRKRINREIRPAKEANPEAPAELLAICDRALAYDAADRYATAGDLAEALETYIAKSGETFAERQLGALVAERFATERSAMQTRIDRQLATLDAPASDTLLTTANGMSTGGSQAPAAMPKAAPNRVPPAAVLAMGGFVIAAAATFLVLRPKTAAPADPLATTASAPPGTTAVASAASATPAASAVDVRVVINPSTAHLELDGVALDGNPFSGSLPRSTTPRKLVATAPGYLPAERTVVLDRDLDLELSLNKRAGGTNPGVGGGPKPGHRSVDDKDPYAK